MDVAFARRSQSSWRRSHRRRCHRRRFGFSIESLEARELLAGDLVPVEDEISVRQESDWTPVDVLSNDRVSPDYDGAVRITAISDGSQGGQVRLADDGASLEYRPLPGISGTERFSYIVDGDFLGIVSVSIESPVEKDEYELVQASGQSKLNVLGNDRFFPNYDGARLISDVSATVTGATVTISDDRRSVFYQAPDDFYGRDQFRYLVDGKFEASVDVWVRRPVQDDYRNEVERNSTDNLLFVLRNDDLHWTIEDEILVVGEITAVSETQNGGTVTIQPDRMSVSYTPPVDFVGSDSFDYIANGKYQARVVVQVTRPVRGDHFDVLQTSQGNVLNVRANDFLSDSYVGARRVTAVTDAENGVVTIRNGRDLVYTPNDDFIGRDYFEYTIDDDLTATVSIDVEGLAASDWYEYGVNPTVTSYVLPVFENDHFGEAGYGGPQVITSVSQPSAGSVEILGNGMLRFLPDHTESNFASFEYTVDDRFTASVRVSLVEYLSNDNTVVSQNSSSNVLNVLENDVFEPDWANVGPYPGPRRITSVSETESGGTVTVGADQQSVRYTPPENYEGSDQFSYTVDGVQTAWVFVTVTSFARADHYRVDPGSTGNSFPVLVNDRDDHGDGKRIARVDPASQGGIATIAADGQSIHYDPAPGFVGTDSFDYYLVSGDRAQVVVEVADNTSQLIPTFDDHSDLGTFLIEDAIDRYHGLFGSQYFSFPSVAWEIDSAFQREERVSSETNVQVAGVDEGDIIEVDSDFLYVLTDDSLLIVDAWPAEEINQASRTMLEGTPLVEYLDGDRLTVISDTSEWIPSSNVDEVQDFGEGLDAKLDSGGLVDLAVVSDIGWGGYWPEPMGTLQSSVTVTVFDVSDPSAPSLVEKTKFDGAYKDSRAINGFVYIVMEDPFALPEPEVICDDGERGDGDGEACTYETEEVYLARVTETIGALIDETLPHFSSYDGSGGFVRGGLLAEASEIFRPTFEDHDQLLIVTSISMLDNNVGPVASAAIPMASTTQLYASLDNLYVFGTDSYSNYDPATNILKFRWNGETGALDFTATGVVPGELHGGEFNGGYVGGIYLPAPYRPSSTGAGQFSIDEKDGLLRIATTTRGLEVGGWNWRLSSDIYVLQDNGGILETVGGLQNMTPDDSIKSVRFMGDRAFVVTFDTSDPFLAIDFTSPTDPQLVGQLLLPGFSSYMQPLTENLVVGMGKNTPDGRNGPAQLSVFDISDLTNPVRLDQYTWDHWSTSEAALDHHAFGFFPYHSVIAMPIGSSRTVREDTDGDGFLDGWVEHRTDDLYAFRYDAAGTLTELGSVSHDWAVRRSGFIDDRLYSVSTDDVIVTDINNPSMEFGRLEFGARMEVDLPNGVPTLTKLTPSPLDDSGVVEILDASRRQLADALQTPVGHVSIVSVEGEVFPTGCQVTSAGESCISSLTSGYEMVLDVSGTRYLYTATSENDVVLREASFDFNVRWAAVQNTEYAEDTNGDGVVSPIDALLVINELGDSNKALRAVDRDYERTLFADVNGDGDISPIDALAVINELNQFTSPSRAAALEAVDSDVVVVPRAAPVAFDSNTNATPAGQLVLSDQTEGSSAAEIQGPKSRFRLPTAEATLQLEKTPSSDVLPTNLVDDLFAKWQV